MPRTTSRRLALTGLTGTIIVLAGCSVVEKNGPAAAVQATPLSDTVVISQPYCTIDGASSDTSRSAARAAPLADPGCGTFSGFRGENATKTYTTGGGHRLLVAIQVADGTPAPELALRRRPDVAFVQDPAVLVDTPASQEAPGRHWVGYRSGEVHFALNEANAGDVVDATVVIPRTADRPASEALETRIAIGAQITDNGFGAEYPAERPVDCREDLSDTPDHDADLGSITCPLADGGDGSYDYGEAPAPETTVVVPTDAAITAPDGERVVAAGETTTVSFVVAQSGVVPEPDEMELRASTTIPGGQASPATGAVPWTIPVEVPDPGTTTTGPTPSERAEATPTDAAPAAAPAPRAAAARAADDATDVPVGIAVPAGTPAGLYDVTLEASDEGGSRSATARIRVPAVPVPAAPAAPAAPATPVPPVTPAAPRKTISATVKLLRATTVSRRTRRVHLGRVTCVRDAGRCTARTRVRIGGRTIGRTTVSIAPKTTGQVTLRLTGPNLRRLIARSARATTTVSADGSLDIVRTTTVRARKATKR